MPSSNHPTVGRTLEQDAETKLLQARRRLVAGDIAGARAVNESILAELPRHAGALLQRSRLESADDNYRIARDFAKRAHEVGISEKWQCLALLRRLRTFNLITELREFIAQLPDEFACDTDVAKLVARLLGSINDPQSALDFTSRAAERNPTSPDLHSAMGLALLNLGRFDEAERSLRECLRLDPGYSAAWWQLSRLRRSGRDRGFVDELRVALRRAKTPRGVGLTAYALHRELDRLGEYGEAANALEQANVAMRQAVNYSAKEDEQLFSALKSMPTEGAGGVIDMPFTPIFIVGMHRSGTTLLEHLLAGHSDICSGGELYDFTSQLRFASDHHCDFELDRRIVEAAADLDYAAIGRGYLASVDWRRSGERFLTDKLPSNFLNIGFILRALPGAKILHLSRDPIETCFSNLREPFSVNTCRFSYDQSELGSYYRHYFALMQHWRQRFPGRIHDATYTALATDPAAELRRVTAFLGIDFQPAMLDTESSQRSVTTASAVQVRQKPGLPLRPKWEPYREYLTPLAWRLADVGQRY